MRGKEFLAFGYLVAARITPAYAGKSRLLTFTSCIRWDHPRLCGEKWLTVLQQLSMTGSPPPMRGKVRSDLIFLGMMRITPAYAGKRKNFFVLSQIERDHPRLCGEKSHPLERAVYRQGSPPPMRGKATAMQTITTALGITPAYAGKRILSRFSEFL